MSKKSFNVVTSAFGTSIDEEATTYNFIEMFGLDTLERLRSLSRNTYATKNPFFPYEEISQRDAFIQRAEANGFSEKAISAYLTFGN